MTTSCAAASAWTWIADARQPVPCICSVAHLEAVTRLAFRPATATSNGGIQLASGSDDRSVRVFDLTL
jgi:hypothetical protein